MSFFIGQNFEQRAIDAISDPDTIVRHDPDAADRFQAIKELRETDPDGELYRGAAFRHVASLVNVPMLSVMKLLDPNFMKDKRNFYGWLDRAQNKRYCVYDRRSAADRAAKFQRDFGHIGREDQVLRIEASTKPAPEGPGVVTNEGAFPGAPVDTTNNSPETDPEAAVGFGFPGPDLPKSKASPV